MFPQTSTFFKLQIFLQLVSEDIKRRMREREANIAILKRKLNSIEDKVFAEFCIRIGVSNIRSYEKEGLRYVTGLIK